MNPLKVLTRPCASGFETAFMVGSERGVVRMPKPAALKKLPAIDAAELVALHHVMGRLKLYGQARLDIAEPVYVSRARLPDWVAAGPGLGADYGYVAFLRKRFAAVPLVYSVDGTLSDLSGPVRLLSTCAPYEDTVPVKNFGKVTVSEHALERVRTRFNVATRSHAWCLLQRALRHDSVREAALSQMQTAHKASKHGEVGRHFTTDSGLTAVVAGNHLRTVYWRKFENL